MAKFSPIQFLLELIQFECNHVFFFGTSSQTPFGYTRKDVLLIGLAVTVVGVGLKSGLEVLQLFYSTFLLLICLQLLWMMVIKCGCSLLIMFSCLCLFTYPILFL